ncbi:acyl carrier protein [Polymorphum gilvum]|uniref:Protein containing GCN5-related N-acetyltransferase domain n=1 Tax=Polymorphum gilvum (strain LMG 25793 / CGMCC 1.9160 / SL003B-26A1) TaxID=991905 RepID=F2IYS6_POLGS|nr:acyl carrier protein [Polymorphum gilvum]ADZ69523.1 Protein containing GCN5-related N-acetyltransferase domain [Polymorphum gilvum SL003B-26A1]
MTRADLEAVLRAELRRIAPDIDVDAIDRSADLRDQFDIDSMDFLTLVTALSKRLGLPMPEADYGEMGSFDALLDYLSAHLG